MRRRGGSHLLKFDLPQDRWCNEWGNVSLQYPLIRLGLPHLRSLTSEDLEVRTTTGRRSRNCAPWQNRVVDSRSSLIYCPNYRKSWCSLGELRGRWSKFTSHACPK